MAVRMELIDLDRMVLFRGRMTQDLCGEKSLLQWFSKKCRAALGGGDSHLHRKYTN